MSDDIERVLALVFILNGRVSELEQSNRELRAGLGLDPPGPALGSDWLALKQAAHAGGLSLAGMRKRIGRGEGEGRKIAGRWLVRK
jgi:hypothetical protein